MLEQDYREQKFIDLKKGAISMHMAFSKLSPLVLFTRRLSINAEISSAQIGSQGDSFGVVARELQTMVTGLEGLIFEIEDVFFQISSFIAHWVRSEEKMRKFQATISTLRKSNGFTRMDNGGNGEGGCSLTKLDDFWNRSMDSGITVEWETEIENIDFEGLEIHIWAALIRARYEVISNLLKMTDLTQALQKTVDGINKVAVRQSHFTAIAARIEAARNNEAGNLMAVAQEMRKLAEEISSAEHQARDKILTLRSLALDVCKPLKKEADSILG